MAQLNFTLDSEVVKGLFLGQAPEVMVPLLEAILHQFLQAMLTETIGAGKYERNDERQAYRNGSRERTLKTRIGTITLDVPRLRNGEFSHELFHRYQRSEQALLLAMMEMVLPGVSTRKVTQITEQLCGTSFSKSTVSMLCKGLDDAVEIFWNRPLPKQYPFIMVDAMYLKVREDGRVQSKALMIAIGVDEEGYLEVLGFDLTDTETEIGWKLSCESLAARGLRLAQYVISDSHKGLSQRVTSSIGWDDLAGLSVALQAQHHGGLSVKTKTPAERGFARALGEQESIYCKRAFTSHLRKIQRASTQVNETMRQRSYIYRPNIVDGFKLPIPWSA